MSKISEMSFLFNISRRYVLFMFRRFYGDFIIVGKENIPDNYPVIFAPNHVNALMDALAVHYIANRNKPLIFLARADIFRNPTAAGFLRFAKIMPAFRMRDGIENLGNNQQVFDECIDILHHNNMVGIMPEGNQETERRLRPIVKGIFRIAFAAQQKSGTQPAVKIIPVGIDYGSIIRAKTHIIINIGKPVDVSDYMTLYHENPVKATNEIRNKFREQLRDLTLDLASEKYYECFEFVVELLQVDASEKKTTAESTLNSFCSRQRIARKLVEIEKTNPEKMLAVEAAAQDLKLILKNVNLKSWIFTNNKYRLLDLIIEAIVLLIGIPFFISGLVLNMFPFFLPVIIRKYVFKAQFSGFFSSLHYGISLITFPLFYMLQTLLATGLCGLIWWQIALFFLVQYPLGEIALKYYKTAVKYLAKLRFILLKKHQPELVTDALNLYEKIAKLVTVE